MTRRDVPDRSVELSPVPPGGPTGPRMAPPMRVGGALGGTVKGPLVGAGPS
jgi:hypothetical protein